MAIKLKTKKEEIDNLRISGKILARALRMGKEYACVGMNTYDLDKYIESKIREKNAIPALINYKPYGADRPFPASVCISINDEVVHGIPNKKKVLELGDKVSLDSCVNYNGMITDHAISFILGEKELKEKGLTKNEEIYLEEVNKLFYITKSALAAGIENARVNNYINNISVAIENVIPKDYGIVKDLSGHGVGYAVHEEPYVPNYDMGDKGPKIESGMVLAIEPMINAGTDEVMLLADGYTVVTADGSISAHFEHTVLITEKGSEILTLE